MVHNSNYIGLFQQKEGLCCDPSNPTNTETISSGFCFFLSLFNISMYKHGYYAAVSYSLLRSHFCNPWADKRTCCCLLHRALLFSLQVNLIRPRKRRGPNIKPVIFQSLGPVWFPLPSCCTYSKCLHCLNYTRITIEIITFRMKYNHRNMNCLPSKGYVLLLIHMFSLKTLRYH